MVISIYTIYQSRWVQLRLSVITVTPYQGGDCVMVKQHRLDPECGGEVNFSWVHDFMFLRWKRMRARQETVLLLFQSARFSQHVHDQYTFFPHAYLWYRSRRSTVQDKRVPRPSFRCFIDLKIHWRWKPYHKQCIWSIRTYTLKLHTGNHVAKPTFFT